MTDLSIPNSFTSGTSIVAADMNANFDAVETLVNTTGVPLVQNGVVGAAALAAPGVATMTSVVGTQTLTAGAADALLSTSASGTSYDTGTMTVTNATARVTAVRAGLYSLTGYANVDPATGTPTVVLYYRVNAGAGVEWNGQQVANASNRYLPLPERILNLSASDYVQMTAQAITNNVDIDGAQFILKYLGPAS